ncbi:hypothetical protein FHE72_23525 (plasmid) [Rossellomorea vietnamensis]|uniref:Phage gp6-like head-tail connector protein n=1 Tax=Rossellomorea vietnamensis TaxID=218284 RepID=A0A6I6ULS2_9BACI|nr:hypothetical protein [Rossellomorea vietnamensis]QHE63965.1 hypothetical protein FHE72_23525 [Rossellomorea vietnamensis]
MDEIVKSSILVELKDNLDITWDDESTNRKLEKHIIRSEAYLQELSGTSLDFVMNIRARDLLLERCRYLYNNVADEFEPNFETELGRFILNEAVRKASESNETTS